MEKIKLFFDFSHVCNYRCVFCRNVNLPQKFLMLEQIKGIDKLVELAESVDITGYGEVTIHPQFFKILDYFTKANVPIRFVTNGSNLTKEVVDKIMLSSVNEIALSVNSLNPNTYTKITGGKGDLNKVLSGIDYLVRRTNALKKDIYIVFSFVITRHTLSEMKDFVDFGKKYDRSVSFLDLTSTITDYTPDLLVPDTEHNRNYIKDVLRYSREQHVKSGGFHLENRKAISDAPKDETELVKIVKECDWVYKQSFVGFNGDVGVCCWSSFIAGNIFEQPFDEIWNGEKYNELRNCIKCGDLKYCKNCRRKG